MRHERRFASTLTDAQWEAIKPLLNHQRRRKHELRTVLEAMFYLNKTGCQWRMLPERFPPWQTVYYYFRRWKHAGLWGRVLERVRETVRLSRGREPSPSAAVIDCQSVRTTTMGGVRGYDGFKKVRGRKREIVVDTDGLLLAVDVHAAHLQESIQAERVVLSMKERFPRMRVFYADQGYESKLVHGALARQGWRLEVVHQKGRKGFAVLPKRWVVERTFGWFEGYRRLSKDFERLTETSEAMIQIAMTRLMLNRL